MAVVTLLCICLVRNLSVERVSKKQLILETAVGGMNHFLKRLLEKRKEIHSVFDVSWHLYWNC